MNKLQNNLTSSTIKKFTLIVITIIFITYISCKLFYLIKTNSVYNLTVLVFTIVYTSLITNLILDNLKLSNNKLIKFLQKIALLNLTLIISIIILNNFDIQLFSEIHCEGDDENDVVSKNSEDLAKENTNKDILSIKNSTDSTEKDYYTFKISKDLVTKTAEVAGSAAKVLGENVVTNVGAASVGVAAVTGMIKATSGMPITSRALAIGAASFAATGGAAAGMEFGKAAAKNTDLLNSMETKNVDTSDLVKTQNITEDDSTPSPTEFFIKSPLENGDNLAPLEIILYSSFIVHLSELILYLLFIYLFINKFVFKLNINFISKLINKYMPDQFNKSQKTINQSIEFNNKFINVMIIIITILLFLFKILNILICTELITGLDDYVLVYNYLKKLIK